MATLAQESSITTTSGNAIQGEALNTGGVWEKHAALSGPGNFLSDGAGGAYASAGDQSFYYGSTPSPASADYRSAVRIKQRGAGGKVGPCVRLDTGGTSYIIAEYRRATDDVQVVWYNGSTSQTESTTSWTPSASDWLWLDVVGNAFTVKTGASTYASATTLVSGTFTGSYPSAAGQPGVFGYDAGSSGAMFDQWFAETASASTSLLPILLHSGSLAGR